MTKEAPIERFLTGVGTSSSNRAPADETSSASPSKAEVGRNVLLTILGEMPGPIAPEQLAAKAELSQDWFEEIIQGLAREQLIDRSAAGLVLTDRGQGAAKLARARLLGSWS